MTEQFPEFEDVEEVYRRAAYFREVFTDKERMAWDDVEQFGADMTALTEGYLLDREMRILDKGGK